MDLSGQERFVIGSSADRRVVPDRLTPEELAFVAGERLLLSAARLLQRADVVSVDIELRGGGFVHGVRAVHVEGPIASTSERRGLWERSIAIDRVIGIRTRMAGEPQE